MHGQFVWYDLMTSDVAGAQRFYPALFGWKTEEFKFADPNQPYTMWKDRGKTFGGVAKLNDEQKKMGVPPSWLVSVMVNNVDETAQKATSLGGKVVAGPFPIPNTGRYAIITDPMGAAIALFSPEGPADAPDVFSWHELMTTDYKRAFDFYQRLFGWEKTGEMDMGGGSMYLMFGQKGRPLGGMYNRPPEMAQVPPNWLPYVAVKDVTASANLAARNGAKVMQPPMDIPGGGSIAVITDPQGAHIAVHSETGLAKASAKVASKPKKKTAKKAAKKSAKGKAKAPKKPKAKSKAKKSAPRKKGGSRKAKKSAKKKGRRR
jgi:predicted enzyme related to lactoylglutathione lyase